MQRVAGYQKLVKQDWKTYVSHTISSQSPVHTNAFFGDYLLKVKQNGHVIHQENFTVDKGGKSLTIHLQGKSVLFCISSGYANLSLDLCKSALWDRGMALELGKWLRLIDSSLSLTL